MKALCLLIFVFFLGRAFAEGSPTALFLTWQHSPESTMTIQWITASDKQKQVDEESDYVTYKSENSDHWQRQIGVHSKLPGNAPYILHSVELTQLHPNQSYIFHIAKEEKPYKFRTMPLSLSTPIRFVVGGDMYHDDLDTLHSMNILAAQTSPNFVLVGGDIAYASGWGTGYLPKWAAKVTNSLRTQSFDRWLAWLQAWTQDMVTPEGYLIPMLPVLGNHDVIGGFEQTPEKAPYFYALFPMPGNLGYNVLDFSNYMTFVLLDSGHTHAIDGAQKEWLKSALETRQNFPYKFALYHVPAYPSYRSYDYRFSKQVRENWVPIFEKYGLSVSFEHHDHDYKRTHPILNGAVNPKGVLYVGDGAWGVIDPREPKSPEKVWYLAKTAGKSHFILVDINGNTAKISAIDANNERIDSFEFQAR